MFAFARVLFWGYPIFDLYPHILAWLPFSIAARLTAHLLTWFPFQVLWASELFMVVVGTHFTFLLIVI